EPLQVRDFVDGERVKVGEIFDTLSVHQLFDDRLAEVLDVHGAPRAEVAQACLELRRTRRVQTAPVRLPGQARGGVAADGAAVGEHVGGRVGRPLGHDHLHDVGDDVAGALDAHGGAHAHVLAPDLVLVVQAHVADGDTGQ